MLSSTHPHQLLRTEPLTDRWRAWANRLIEREWHSTRIVTRGVVHLSERLPGFITFYDTRPVGLLTYNMKDDECEIGTLNSLKQGIGVGSTLIDAVRNQAVTSGCHRLWLITTNDNLKAIRFYQRRGFHLCALYPNAVEQSRKLKPEIPLIGLDEIPLRDEVELEMIL